MSKKSLSVVISPQALYKRFIEWYVMPMGERVDKGAPSSIAEFCTHYGVKGDTVASYLDVGSFQDDLQDGAMNWAKSKTPFILQKMYEKLKKDLKPEDLREWRALVFDSSRKNNEGTRYQIQNNFFATDDRQYQQIVEREAKRLSKTPDE